MNIKHLACFMLLALPFSGCGTLQVGIEAALPAPTLVASATAMPTETSALPTLTPTHAAPMPSPTGRIAPTPTTAPERITFPVNGTNFTFATKLTPGTIERYVLQIMAQQRMTITTSSQVSIDVFDAKYKPLKATASQPGQWQGTIPQTGDYIIALRGQGLINVSIDIPPPD